jgi:hypothetical protein
MQLSIEKKNITHVPVQYISSKFRLCSKTLTKLPDLTVTVYCSVYPVPDICCSSLLIYLCLRYRNAERAMYFNSYLFLGFSVTNLEALSPAVLEDALQATSLALQTVLSVIGKFKHAQVIRSLCRMHCKPPTLPYGLYFLLYR